MILFLVLQSLLILFLLPQVRRQKQIQQALRGSEERFRELADLLPQSVFEADLQGRVTLLEQVRRVDYPFDRLLVHIAELVPDGLVLDVLEVRPPGRSQGGRPGLTGGTSELSPGLQAAYTLTLRGTAQRAEVLTRFTEAMTRSPLFHEPQSTPNVLPEGGLSFSITTRLPGSGQKLEGEGP